ncbi:MAG TPA: hypothetical protein VJC21_05825 [Candidatus Nanoarchaeia archaeon]|nr:hypothetical protein [Candidatus Nanoarchaeia archaeon]
MTLEHKISGEFQSQLEKLSETGKIRVIIWGVMPTSEGFSEIPSEGGWTEARTRNQEAIRPILKYGEERGIEYLGKSEVFGMVYGSLTRSQVYALAEQPYVRLIGEDQKLEIDLPACS